MSRSRHQRLRLYWTRYPAWDPGTTAVDRLASERRRSRWNFERLQSVLASELGIDPLQVTIDRTCLHCGHFRHGKPTIAAALDFSVSHTTSTWAVAVAEETVGLDLEEPAAALRVWDLRDQVLTTSESSRIRRLSSSQREAAVLAIWTAKEAVLKAMGLGLSINPKDVEVALDESLRPFYAVVPHRRDWHALPVRAGTATGCVAVPAGAVSSRADALIIDVAND